MARSMYFRDKGRVNNIFFIRNNALHYTIMPKIPGYEKAGHFSNAIRGIRWKGK